MTEETIIHQDPHIKITNLRAIIAEKTYSVANITAVEAIEQPPSGAAPGCLMLIGVIALLMSLPTLFNNRAWDNNYTAIIVGVIFTLAGSILFRNAKPIYILQISTASGEVKALTSQDKNHIHAIAAALNQAIIQRG